MSSNWSSTGRGLISVPSMCINKRCQCNQCMSKWTFEYALQLPSTKQRFHSINETSQKLYKASVLSIGTASANSAKFRGIRPWMYIQDLL